MKFWVPDSSTNKGVDEIRKKDYSLVVSFRKKIIEIYYNALYSCTSCVKAYEGEEVSRL